MIIEKTDYLEDYLDFISIEIARYEKNYADAVINRKSKSIKQIISNQLEAVKILRAKFKLLTTWHKPLREMPEAEKRIDIKFYYQNKDYEIRPGFYDGNTECFMQYLESKGAEQVRWDRIEWRYVPEF